MASNSNIYKLSNAGGVKTLARYHDMLAGNPAVLVGDFESIETFVVGAGGSTGITFGAGGTIPQGYKHLQIRGLSTTQYGTDDQGYISIQFNGDTGTNYTRHQFWGNGAGSAASYGAGSLTNAICGFDALVGSRTLYHCAHIIDIWDYNNTSKGKTIKSLSGMDFNGSGFVGEFSGAWTGTAAITSIKIYSTNGSFKQNTTFELYGIKG